MTDRTASPVTDPGTAAPNSGVLATRSAAWRQRGDWLPPDSFAGQLLRGLRWAAVGLWFVCVGYFWTVDGLPFGRSDLLLWLATGLIAFSVGRHPVWLLWVLVDFVPFAAVLVAYDYLRGWADTAGMPTWWHPQIDLDRTLFGGTVPNIWLQRELKFPDVRWYDVVVCACYYSFFFLPYVTAAVMWLRSRADFYRWSLRFVALSLLGFGLFVLVPSAPPWAAARCTAAQVADHPHSPPCMSQPAQDVPGNLLGAFGQPRPGAMPYLEQIVPRGFSELHLGVANTLLAEGRVSADAVAAVPSLHLGGTVLFVLFLWPRVSASRLRNLWRPILVAYPFVMTFSLVYAGEHYVTDCLAGALVAALVHLAAGAIERRRRPAPPDTLRRDPDFVPEPILET